MDNPEEFWNLMFVETESLGFPQPYIAIPNVAYEHDKRVIDAAAERHGFSRVICTGDTKNTHYCRYV